MTSVRGALSAVLLASLAITGADCRVFDESLLDVDGRDASADSPAADTGVDAPEDSAKCPLRRPPRRPSGEDADGPEVVFALRNIFLVQGNEWSRTGFDLDGRCTGPPDFDVECQPPSKASPEVDGEEGIDNSVGHNLLPLVDVVYGGELQSFVRGAQDGGNGVFIFRVRGYGGGADDPRVDVTISQSVAGTVPLPDDTAPMLRIMGTDDVTLPDGSKPPPPAWDGRDFFWLRSDTLAGGNLEQPLVRDDNAYVSGRTLVIRPRDRVDIVFSGVGVGVLVNLSDPLFTLELSEDLQTVPTAVFAGRWAITDILNTAESIGICQGDPLYTVTYDALQEAADVRSDPTSGGSGLSCDAVSIGVTADGVRARIGGVGVPNPRPDSCGNPMLDAGAGDSGARDTGAGDTGVAGDAGGSGGAGGTSDAGDE